MPEVSVIVPVYKVEPYIHECVDSVLNQTFTDLELILLDDGSPDRCGEICDQYAAQDSRVSVVHLENGGQGRARNIGIDMAQGKYIIFLDSDDYWLPKTLEILYSEAEKNQTQVVNFGFAEFSDDNDLVINTIRGQHTVQNNIVKTGPESLKCAMDAQEYYAESWTRFYRTDYLRGSGVRYDVGTTHEDVIFSFLSYLFAVRVECIGDCFYQYRIHPSSTLRTESLQTSAHGQLVAINGFFEVWQCQPQYTLEKELLERYLDHRVRMIRGVYRKALKKRPSVAFAIQKDARAFLKRVRVIPTLSKTARLCTYSLFLGWLIPAIVRKLRRMIKGEPQT